MFGNIRFDVKPLEISDIPYEACTLHRDLQIHASAYSRSVTSRSVSFPTINDVAAAAGVSTATVSRVLNRPQTVRDTLRQRVIEAVVRLGYVPHAGARSLMLNRSGTVGAIFPTVDNAIFAKAIDALQRRLADAGLQLLIATSGYDLDTEVRQAMNLVTRGADALALCGIGQSPQLLRFLRQRKLPTVHVMTYPAPPDMLCVGFDNARAIGQAVRYLLDLGHRRVAMLAGITRDNDRAAARVAGVRQALKEAKLDLSPPYLVECRYALAEARHGFRSLMTAVPAPTAVVCGNDVLAFGALLEAQRMGIAVPKAVSIVGFDDLEMARHVLPALTTVHVPTEQMWCAAADRLIEAIAQRPLRPATEVEVELMVRDSTGPAPRR
ncbi:MAG: LacI family DNA-binding transcriptional regulator [Caldimonas sp.]